MISAVRLAAMMPARRAVCSGSPFFTARVRMARPRRRVHAHFAFGDRLADGLGLGGDVHHAHAPPLVDVRQPGRAARLAVLHRHLPREEEGQALERHREVHVLQLHARRHLERAGREVEDRTDAGLHGGVDDALSGFGRHGHDRDVDVIS